MSAAEDDAAPEFVASATIGNRFLARVIGFTGNVEIRDGMLTINKSKGLVKVTARSAVLQVGGCDVLSRGSCRGYTRRRGWQVPVSVGQRPIESRRFVMEGMSGHSAAVDAREVRMGDLVDEFVLEDFRLTWLQEIAGSESALWCLHGHEVVRIDSPTAAVTAAASVERFGKNRFSAAEPLTALTISDGVLLFAHHKGNAVFGLDATALEELWDPVEVPDPTALAAAGDSIWVGSKKGFVVPLATETGTVGEPVPLCKKRVGSMAGGNRSLWATDPKANALVRLDPTTGEASDPIPVKKPNRVVLAGGYACVLSEGKQITRFDEIDGSQVGEPIAVGGDWLTADGDRLYLRQRGQNLKIIDASTGRELAEMPIPLFAGVVTLVSRGIALTEDATWIVIEKGRSTQGEDARLVRVAGRL